MARRRTIIRIPFLKFKISKNTIFNILGFFVIGIAVLFLLSGHMFNTRKLKFVKLNITGGAVLIFISLLGIFQSGSLGELIFHNLSLDFSLFGAIVILSTIFFIGLILLLDTSIDVFFLFLFNLGKSSFNFLKAY